MARVIVEENNFVNAKLTQKHSHLPSETKLCKTKMDKKVDKICNDRKYITTREAYLLVRKDTPSDEVDNAPDRKSYSTRVHRIKKQYEPKLPHSFEEFDELINDENYKKRYNIYLRIRLFILIACVHRNMINFDSLMTTSTSISNELDSVDISVKEFALELKQTRSNLTNEFYSTAGCRHHLSFCILYDLLVASLFLW